MMEANHCKGALRSCGCYATAQHASQVVSYSAARLGAVVQALQPSECAQQLHLQAFAMGEAWKEP